MSNKKKNKCSGNPLIRHFTDAAMKSFASYRSEFEKEIDKVDTVLFFPSLRVQKRRITAMWNYLPKIKEEAVKTYPVINPQYELISFFTAPDAAFLSLGSRDSFAYWSLAAALWILDELRANGNIDELQLDEYMKDDEFQVNIPEIVDFVHPPRLVRAMVKLIQMQMLDVKKGRLMFHSVNAEFGSKDLKTDPKPHIDFMQVVNLIDPEHIQKATDSLETKVLEVLNHYLSCMNLFMPYMKNNKEYSVQITREISVAILSYGKDEKLEFPDYPKVEQQFEYFNNNFSVDDPFEICFAVFYLLAVGSDLVWLYTPLIPILNQCWEHLPWCIRINDESETDNSELYANGMQNITIANASIEPWTCLIAKGLLPRYHADNENMLDLLKSYGFPEDKAEEYAPFMALIAVHREFAIRQETIHKKILADLKAEYEECTVTKEPVLLNDPQNNHKLQEEIDHLEKLLKQERHEKTKLQKRIADMREDQKQDYEELTALREYVYHLEDTEETVTKISTFPIPYHTDGKRIVCIGGSESWQQKVKEYLPDVRFSKPDVNTNIDVFKYADEIWVQRCGLLHKEVFPVRNISKSRNIPLKYFTSLNALNCAEQVAEYDTKLHKAG